MLILFPCEFQNINKVDSNFEKEYNTCQTLGIESAFFDHDTFVDKGKVITTLDKTEEDIILRSWMLNNVQYFKLFDYFRECFKCELINNPAQYTHCHYFPNVYQDIRDYTPAIIVAHEKDINDDLLENIHFDIHNDMIIKDFVKSEKGTNLFKINSNISLEDFKKFVFDFIKARKPLFNEGIVLKKWVNLKKDKLGNTNEWRAFFLNGKMISLNQNSNFADDFNNQLSPDIVYDVASKITKSIFFTIDFALTENGKWIVLECGDGQVSGLALHANEFEFYQNLINEYNKTT